MSSALMDFKHLLAASDSCNEKVKPTVEFQTRPSWRKPIERQQWSAEVA